MQAEHWPWKDPELAERSNGNLGGKNDWAGVRSPDWSDVGERKSTTRQVLHTTRSKISLKMSCLIKRSIPVHLNALFVLKVKLLLDKEPSSRKLHESNCYCEQLFPRRINGTNIINLFNKNDWTIYCMYQIIVLTILKMGVGVNWLGRYGNEKGAILYPTAEVNFIKRNGPELEQDGATWLVSELRRYKQRRDLSNLIVQLN
jgi:hypothetical protein